MKSNMLMPTWLQKNQHNNRELIHYVVQNGGLVEGRGFSFREDERSAAIGDSKPLIRWQIEN